MDLQAKIRTLPPEPGVYLYKNAAGDVIYVGKAKNLRSRVASYFHEARWEDAKTGTLVREAVVDGFPHQGSGLGIFPACFVEVAGHPAAQVLRLTHVNDVACGVLVQIHAGLRGKSADFGLQVHAEESILTDGKCRHCVTKRLMSLSCVARKFFPRNLLAASFLLSLVFNGSSGAAAAQTITPAPAAQSN